MNQNATTHAPISTKPAIGFFERYLTIWVALCIVVGIALGQAMPGAFQAIGSMEYAQVNLPVGILIWIMIIPMLLKIDFGALGQVKSHWRGIGVTLFINWAVKPFSMALLGWLFVRHLFAPMLPAEQLDSYIAGLILLAAAPCTAMVFVWSKLTDGDPYFTLSQVALNDVIMIFAFAPIVGLLLGIASITVPWDTLLTSVVLYIVIPVILAQLLRRSLLKRGEAVYRTALARLGPWSIAALLATLVLLFAFQGEAILEQPLIIAMLAVPILIQVFFNSGLAYWLNRRMGEKHSVACPSALIGASNFFELAVAAAISLFGFNSGAALATSSVPAMPLEPGRLSTMTDCLNASLNPCATRRAVISVDAPGDCGTMIRIGRTGNGDSAAIAPGATIAAPRDAQNISVFMAPPSTSGSIAAPQTPVRGPHRDPPITGAGCPPT